MSILMSNKLEKYLTLIILIISILLSAVLLYNYIDTWEFYVNYNSGELLFWSWIKVSIYTIITYNIFRIHSFVKNESLKDQESFKKIFLYLLLLIFIVHLPFIIHYIFYLFSEFWQVQGYAEETSSNLLIRIFKAIIGFILLGFKYIYQFIKTIVTDSMIEVGFLGDAEYTIGDKTYSAKDLPLIYDIASVIVCYMLIQYRKVIIRITNFLYSIVGYFRRLLFGNDNQIMKKGILGWIIGKGSWFKKLIFFLLGIQEIKDTSRGSAEFASKAEQKDIISKNKNGLLIDGIQSIPWDLSMRHVAIIAPTGKGKTSNYVIPNILSLPEFINPNTGKSASAIIADPKGEIFENTAQYLSEQGYNIKTIRVTEPLKSELFNPLQRVSKDKEIGKLAEIMMNSVNKEGGDLFWSNQAIMLLANVIRIIKNSEIPLEYQNLHNVKRFIDLMGSDGNSLADFVTTKCKDHQAVIEYSSFILQNEKTLSGILMNAKMALKDLSYSEIAQLTSKDTINFELLRSEKTVIYIITPFTDVKYYKFFLTTLYSQLFDFCIKNEKGNDILFMMDEFGNLGKIPEFAQVITTLRSSRCSVSLILQDMEQLNKVYGNSEASIIFNGGCSSNIIFGGIRNTRILKDIVNILGNQTLEQKTKDGRELAPISRPLKTVQELYAMKKGEGIFISGDSKPIELKMTRYGVSHLSKRVKQDDAGDYITPPTPNRKEDDLSVDFFDFESYIKDE